MSNFVKHFADMFTKNASVSACSSCGAVNTTVAEFDFVNLTDTVFAVSVLLCSLFILVSLVLLSLINIFVLAGIILINLVCLKKTLCKKRNIIKF